MHRSCRTRGASSWGEKAAADPTLLGPIRPHYPRCSTIRSLHFCLRACPTTFFRHPPGSRRVTPNFCYSEVSSFFFSLKKKNAPPARILYFRSTKGARRSSKMVLIGTYSPCLNKYPVLIPTFVGYATLCLAMLGYAMPCYPMLRLGAGCWVLVQKPC